jgi:hypothetical protein
MGKTLCNLRKIREELALTVDQLHFLLHDRGLDVSRAALENWLSGKAVPEIAVRPKLTEILSGAAGREIHESELVMEVPV